MSESIIQNISNLYTGDEEEKRILAQIAIRKAIDRYKFNFSHLLKWLENGIRFCLNNNFERKFHKSNSIEMLRERIRFSHEI